MISSAVAFLGGLAHILGLGKMEWALENGVITENVEITNVAVIFSSQNLEVS